MDGPSMSLNSRVLSGPAGRFLVGHLVAARRIAWVLRRTRLRVPRVGRRARVASGRGAIRRRLWVPRHRHARLRRQRHAGLPACGGCSYVTSRRICCRSSRGRVPTVRRLRVGMGVGLVWLRRVACGCAVRGRSCAVRCRAVRASRRRGSVWRTAVSRRRLVRIHRRWRRCRRIMRSGRRGGCVIGSRCRCRCRRWRWRRCWRRGRHRRCGWLGLLDGALTLLHQLHFRQRRRAWGWQDL